MHNTTNSQSTSRHTQLLLVVILAGALYCPALFCQVETGYSGKAYGTKVSVTPGNSSITSGTTTVSLICTEQTGISNSNSVANVVLPPLASTGLIDTSVVSAAAGNANSSTAMATVNGINLLGGLVTAEAVESVSSSISSSGGFSTSSAGTTFTNAHVLGLPVHINVAPNTRIVLPGIGYVVLNEQGSQVTSTGARLTVNAIHIKVSQDNTLGLPIGTDLIVAHAQSDTLINEGLLAGFGYGSSVNAGTVQAGRSAEVTLGCTGTNDEVESNDVAGVNVPGILTAGVVHTTATGTVTPAGASGTITASVAGVDLLASLVTASAVTAQANAASGSGGITLSDTGSLFVGLAVAGHPEIGANPDPNTRVSIAGLGTLWLHRVLQTSTSIEVRMVELVVDVDNSFGLPVGADIRVAVAHTGVIH